MRCPCAPPALRRVWPQLERLEDRRVPSTIAAVGTTIFAVTADNGLWEHTPTVWTQLSPSGTIQSISAGTDANGGAAVWAVAGDASFWEWTDSRGWAELSAAGTIGTFNAAGNDVVFALAGDHSFWEHSPSGWAELSPPDAIRSFTPGVGDEVFVFAADGSFWRHAASSWEQLSPAGTIQDYAVAGANDAFALASDHSYWEHTSSGWAELSPAGTIVSLAGAEQGKGLVVASDGDLWQHDYSGWTPLNFTPPVQQISLSAFFQDHGEGGLLTPVVFARTTDNALWQGTEAFGGTTWSEISPPETIRWVSAAFIQPSIGVPRNGYPDVFVVAGDFSLWEMNESSSSGWVELSPAGTMHGF